MAKQEVTAPPTPACPPLSLNLSACEVPGSELLTLSKPLMSTKEDAKAQNAQEVPRPRSLVGLGLQGGWAGEAMQALMGAQSEPSQGQEEG